MFDKDEVEFYQAWIDALDQLGYKWPELIKTSASSRSMEEQKIIYQSVEQDHSTNSNFRNEISLRVSLKASSRLTSIKETCGLELIKTNSCQFTNILLITEASSIQDLTYIDMSVNLFFPYTIVCVPPDLNLTGSDYFFTRIVEVSFKDCLDTAKRMGFKQQSFVIAKNIREFKFWDKMQIVKTSEPPADHADKIVFWRQNVANGYGLVQIEASPTSGLCSFFSLKTENSVCSSFNEAMNKLNWHSNDLASEYCSDLRVKTIWIPDLHDGTRIDLSSTLLHLGSFLGVLFLF